MSEIRLEDAGRLTHYAMSEFGGRAQGQQSGHLDEFRTKLGLGCDRKRPPMSLSSRSGSSNARLIRASSVEVQLLA